MPNIKTQATVIGFANYRENDRMLTLLSSDMGKISVLARGCRKSKSPFLSASELMATGEFVLYFNNNRYTLVSATIENSYYKICLDAYKFYCASFALELCSVLTQENEDNNKILTILNNTLALIENDTTNNELAIINRFVFLILKYAGFKPRIVHCCNCESKISSENNEKLGFDFINGGVLCSHCVDENSHIISKTTYLEMFKLAQFKKYDYIASSKNIDVLVFSILRKYLEAQLQYKFKSSKFLLIEGNK